MCEKTKRESYLIDAPISNSHNVHITIITKLQKYTYWKEELTIIWQLNAVRLVHLVLSKLELFPKTTWELEAAQSLPWSMYIVMQKACCTVGKFLEE